MADIALKVTVSPLLELICDNLSSLIVKEFGLLWGVDKELEKLSDIVSTIQLVLKDAEVKQINDVATRVRLRKLKDAAYEAEDIIDECATEAPLLESNISYKSCTKQVCASVSTCFRFKTIMFRHKIARKIKVVVEKFDIICAERVKFDLRVGGVEKEPNQNRESSSSLSEPEVYGRDEDKDKIVSFLLNAVASQNDLSVYPIQGMGGMGKTTVAKLVYNDQRLVEKFEAKIWVCVPEDFGVKRLMKMIIETLGEVCKLENLEPIEKRLKELLNEKKFLLVLDDVWNENSNKWDELRIPLTCGAKGSSIIVTTRELKVASIMGTHPAHQLTALSEDDCWSLFKARVFGVGNEVNGELEAIGKQIVKKCGGLPLAAKALGGSLCCEQDVNKWKSVRDSEIWELGQDNDGDILPSLRLSYNHLPSQLRQCFAYCSIFPKDYEMEKEELIRLWMANDFVHTDERMELEDIGNWNFNELISRSFFQDVRKDEYYDITYCKMHDLMHDLACSITKDECYALESEEQVSNIPKNIRHLSFGNKAYGGVRQNILEMLSVSHPFLRTCLLQKWFPFPSPVEIKFSNLNCLRVLNLRHTTISNLPASIGKMKHLRYLNLSRTKVELLPESICGLINLQTLQLRSCESLTRLPKSMRNLINLRHLECSGCDALGEMPVGMGQLSCLRTLELFIVGQESGRRMKELQGLNRLRGELEIKGLEHVRYATEAKEANLAAKQNLSSLSLIWRNSGGGEAEEGVLEALQPPHQSLKKLEIDGYGGSVFPNWMTLLQNVAEIGLDCCNKCEHLPPLGQLTLLKQLSIFSCHELELSSGDFQHLINLGTLELGWLPKLTSLPDLQHLTALQSLEIYECNELELSSGNFQHLISLGTLYFSRLPKLTSLPDVQHLTALQSLYIYECNELELSSGDFQHLISLGTLHLERLPKLTSLPDLQHLTVLRRLDIAECKNLAVLPQEMQNLTSLRYLTIRECHPDLYVRCEKDKGDYWPYISHIPQLRITESW